MHKQNAMQNIKMSTENAGKANDGQRKLQGGENARKDNDG